ncbi:High-affinity methionine permease [Diplocarpon rosae]|nr:High-affinity methionine permease [Diplocarpon rosae]
MSSTRQSSTSYRSRAGTTPSRHIKAEASGAPVESESPLGYEVSWLTVILLNVGQMVGTGVFSTPGSILSALGSVGLSLVYWVLGLIIAMAGLLVYLELASYFPNRSGGEVVYLEQGWPRPKYFLPTAFAAYKVIFSFGSSNAIVLSTYLYRTAGSTPTEWQSKGVAIAGYTVAIAIVTFSNKWSLRFSNAITVVKLLTLVFITVTGFVVLAGGIDAVPDPGFNFRNSFDGTTNDAYGITNALVRINFAYSGWENCFNVVAEIKARSTPPGRPTRVDVVAETDQDRAVGWSSVHHHRRRALHVVPKDEIVEGNTITASLFFAKVFGAGNAARALNILILLSAFGNLVSVLIGQGRMIRECGRFAPLDLSLRGVVGSSVDLALYPNSVFLGLMAVGLFSIRRYRSRIHVGRAEFRAYDGVVVFYLAVQVFLLVMPWVPPEGGIYAGNVSFLYATAPIVGIGLLLVCGVYYWVWIIVLPTHRRYAIRQELIVLDTGEATHSLIRVPLEKIAEWDSVHDVTGRVYEDRSRGERQNAKAVKQAV